MEQFFSYIKSFDIISLSWKMLEFENYLKMVIFSEIPSNVLCIRIIGEEGSKRLKGSHGVIETAFSMLLVETTT